jgi:hypothetical protein
MKIFRNILFILYFLEIHGYEAIGQVELNKTVEFIPQKFVVPVKDVNILKTNAVLDGNIWEVFSDRNYNTTQVSLSKSNMFKTLSYLDQYYVVEYHKEYLHIIKDDSLSETGEVSDFAEDYGWIHASKLLLWKHCLTDHYGRDRRVFMFKGKKTNDFFDDSDKNQQPSYFQVLYVYKEENDRFLLSRSSRLTGDSLQLKENILGWVNKELVYSWDDNTFVQPEAINTEVTGQERTIYYPIFSGGGGVKTLSKKSKIKSEQVIWKMNQPEVWDYNNFRFPLISKKDYIGQVDFVFDFEQTTSQSLVLDRLPFISGYCLIDGSDKAVSFKTVVLLSKNQLSELLIIYEKLLSLLQDEERSYQTALKLTEIFSHANFLTTEKIETATLYNLFEWKYGLSAVKKSIEPPFYRIVNLSAKENYELISRLEDAHKLIDSLFLQQSSINSFYSNSTVYYWVPLDHFPLFEYSKSK